MEHSVANYKIRFLAGELAGRVFAVRNSGTLIGRRRDADIRPGGLDIGAEHVTLLPQSARHANESARVNGDEVIGEGDFLLLPGADVRIGKELTFVLEEDDSPATPDSATVPSADPEEATEELTGETAGEESDGAAPSNDADCPRYASGFRVGESGHLARGSFR